MVVFIKFEVENNIDWLVALLNLFGMSWYNNIALKFLTSKDGVIDY